MRRTPIVASLQAALLLGAATLSPAQDAPPGPARTDPPPAPATEDPAAEKPPTDTEDAAARKHLEAAAERQGGGSLTPPDGKLESFRIVFHKVTIYRDKPSEGGTTRQRMDSMDDGLKVYWRAPVPSEPSLRTEWRLEGDRPVARGVRFLDRRDKDGNKLEQAWVDSGDRVDRFSMKPSKDADDPFRKDREQIERDREVVDALLDVAILRRMTSDGSRWKIVGDAPVVGSDVPEGAVAIRRTPPAGSRIPLRLTLWIHPESRDVVAARISPNDPGESTMHYTFKYRDDFPEILGPAAADGTAGPRPVNRFPFEFHVFEQRIPEQTPMPVMDGWAKLVSFNDLADADVSPPAAR